MIFFLKPGWTAKTLVELNEDYYYIANIFYSYLVNIILANLLSP